jgi:hypothetical protein
MTPVSEAVERVLTIRNGLEDGTLGPTPDLMLEALEAGATLAEEQRAKLARLTEQVRVAREGLERAAYPGPDELLSPCFIARETIVQMERIDGKDEDYTQTPKAPNSKTGQRQVSAQSKVGADGISSLKETTIPHGEE